jgi:integrase
MMYANESIGRGPRRQIVIRPLPARHRGSRDGPDRQGAKLRSVGLRLTVMARANRRLYDRVMVLLSVKGGLRAKEIAMVTRGMVTDAEGNVGDALHLLNGASKGKKGGRTVPLNAALRGALIALKARRNGVEPGDRIIHSKRDIGMSPGAVQVWFHRLYKEKLGLDGASSHSGRRTFVTRCAKNIVAAGGSLRDVQELAGHASLATTQRYIQGDTAAKRRVVDL